jgi:1,2-diacylglycerol 3-beta-glucosyltransferase
MNAHWLIIAAVVVANLMVLPYFGFLLAATLAAVATGRRRTESNDPSSKFLIVIPAHDEESGIANTVRSCLGSAYPSTLFQVTVIADNCTDRTASLARESGARVFERTDHTKKSKGYAIEYLLESLGHSGELDTLDAVVIVDADTTIDPDLLSSFDKGLRQGHDWMQAYYTVANPDQSWRTRLMTYAFSLFNGVLLLGQNALGSSAGFKGNGMCFSTRGLRRRPWKSYGLVEDMEYSWTLRIAGEKIWFLPEASVYGAMLGSGGTAAAHQRRRWEFGRLDIRNKYLGQLLRSNDLGWLEKLVSACELTIPSMAVLAIIYLGIVAVDDFMWLVTRGSHVRILREFLLACGVFMTVALGAYAISPFVVMRLPIKYLSSVVLFPFYMSWKLLVSVGGRPQQWVRTMRETHK